MIFDTPTHLTIAIEHIETVGLKIVWLKPLNDHGSLMFVEGTVSARLWLYQDGKEVLTHQWSGIPFNHNNYTLFSKGAEIQLLYADGEHDYEEPGNLEVTLTLTDGTVLTARLEKISLHPY